MGSSSSFVSFVTVEAGFRVELGGGVGNCSCSFASPFVFIGGGPLPLPMLPPSPNCGDFCTIPPSLRFGDFCPIPPSLNCGDRWLSPVSTGGHCLGGCLAGGGLL